MCGRQVHSRTSTALPQGVASTCRLEELTFHTGLPNIQFCVCLTSITLQGTGTSGPQAPVGGEDAAKVVREYGSRPEFGFEPKDHLFLGEVLGLIDFETGAKVSGTKFVYLRRAAALLEMALCNWAMQRAVARGFEPLTTPDLVRASVLEKCGFQPRAENTQVRLGIVGLVLTEASEASLGESERLHRMDSIRSVHLAKCDSGGGAF